MESAPDPLPPLESHLFKAFALDNNHANNASVRNAKSAFKERNVAECTRHMLMAFENSFISPRLFHSKLDFKDWEIYFHDPLFRHLRIRRSSVEGVVNIYERGKKVRSFNVLDSPRVWQIMVEWIWRYGRKRQIALKAHQQMQGQPANMSEPVPQPLLRQALGRADPNAQAEKSPPTEGTDCMQKDTSAAEDVNHGFGILSLLEQNDEMVLEAQPGVEQRFGTTAAEHVNLYSAALALWFGSRHQWRLEAS